MGRAGGNHVASAGWFGGWPVIPGKDRWDERVLRSFGDVGWLAAAQSSKPHGGVGHVRAGPFGPGTILAGPSGRGPDHPFGSRPTPRRPASVPFLRPAPETTWPATPAADRLTACTCYESAEAWFKSELGAVVGEPSSFVCGGEAVYLGATFAYEPSRSPIEPGYCVPVAQCSDRSEASECCATAAATDSWGAVHAVCSRFGANWGAGAAPYQFLDVAYAGDGYCWVRANCNANDGSDDQLKWGLFASDVCSPPATYPTRTRTFPGLFECGNLPGEKPIGPYPNPPDLWERIVVDSEHAVTDLKRFRGCLLNNSNRTLQGSRSASADFPQQEVMITPNGLCQNFDLDFAQDCYGTWYKIGANTATATEDGLGGCVITGAKCQISESPWGNDTCLP